MTAEDLLRMSTQVRYLMDRAEILDRIATHARGCDRHDADLMTQAYHPDGWDVHGHTANPGPAYGAWANAIHAATSQTHTHNITTHTCEIDGDSAHAETYVLVGLLSPDGGSTTLMGGRYLDRLERRDGVWRIVVRRSTVEWTLTGDAAVLAAKGFTAQGYVKGARDAGDLSYQRPLQRDTPAERW